MHTSIGESLDFLKTSAVETMFLHVPDCETPFEYMLKAMNDTFQQGKFKNLGLSNYTAAEVQKIIDICEEKGYIKPSVYEGHYNPLVRGGEKELFPILRKHNMAFFVYRSAEFVAMFDLELTFVSVLQRGVSFQAILLLRNGGARM